MKTDFRVRSSSWFVMQLSMAVNQSVFVASDWLACALNREVSASRANSCTFPLQTESVQLHPLLLLLLPPSLHVFITHRPPTHPHLQSHTLILSYEVSSRIFGRIQNSSVIGEEFWQENTNQYDSFQTGFAADVVTRDDNSVLCFLHNLYHHKKCVYLFN